MKYREHLNIILMRDNGPRRSFRIRRSRFFVLLAFFAVLPLIAVALALHVWQLWHENTELHHRLLRLESEWQNARATASRLENLAALLQEEESLSHELVVRQLGGTQPSLPDSETLASQGDGPGHEEFPVTDTGYVSIRNVQARALRGDKLRIALDLHNTDRQEQATGTVQASLITADGKRHELTMEPEKVGDFRIQRFKRAVMVCRLPSQINLTNAQVVIEVFQREGNTLCFRNIYAVEH